MRAALAHLGLILGGITAALGLGELGVRATHDSLPSLAALEGVDAREHDEVRRWTDPPGDPSTCGEANPRAGVRPRVDRLGESITRDLWVVGDSLVHGWGVGPTASWPYPVAQAVGERTGRGVRLTRLGGPGLGYCGLASSLNAALDRSTPDLVVWQVFADDLERRSLVMVGDEVAARPSHPLFWQSWLANRLWFAWVPRHGSAQPTRDADGAGLARFARVMGGVADRLASADVPLVVALVAPAGIERCRAGAAAWSDCDWLLADEAALGESLAEVGVPVVDLTDLWAEVDPETLPDEEAAWLDRGRLPVHPGVGGHRALAEAITPAVLERVGPGWPRVAVADR